MTDISEIQVGDRVRATQGEEEAVFTVGDKSTAFTGWLEAKTSGAIFYPSEGWEFEVIEKAPRPMMKPGLYRVTEEDTDISEYKRVILTTNDEWFWLDFTSSSPAERLRNPENYDLYPIYPRKGQLTCSSSSSPRPE